MLAPTKVIKHSPCEHDEVGLVFGDERVGLFRRDDQSDGSRGNACLAFDALSEVHHVAGQQGWEFHFRPTIASRGSDVVRASGMQCPRKRHCVFESCSAHVPIVAVDTYAQRFVR